jgi:hypothetical protein
MVAMIGLLRLAIRLDRRAAPEEVAAYRAILRAAGPPREAVDGDAPYREATAAAPEDDAGLAALEARADRELASAADVQAAARAVTRPAAREAIFAALADLAAADAIDASEAELLEWLAREWSLESSPAI